MLPAKGSFGLNLAARALSATILIPAVLAAVWYGGGPFLLLLAISVGLMAVEWSKMSAPNAPAEVAVTITVAVLASVFAAYIGQYPSAWLIMIGGGIVAAIASRHKAERAIDAGYGVFYIAPACIAMTWLRNTAVEGFSWTPGVGVSWTILMFAIVWAADIGAYAVGNLLKGPKLWPRISPNKTWSGFVGGLVIAGLAALGISHLFDAIDLSLGASFVVGLLGGFATMAGDLWESVLKRRFGVKDSGDLIPGHGGLLDRVDGLMFAAIAIAGFRLAYGHGWLI